MRKSVSLVLAAVLALGLCAAASAGQEGTTNATIKFKEGELRFSTNQDAMNIAFGTHEIPVGAVTYGSVTNNTLSIADPRHPAGGWEVTVKREGSFTEVGNSKFEGVLTLMSGTAGHSGGEGIDLSEVSVTSNVVVGDTAQTVATAAADQTTGTFLIQWDAGNITLELTGAEAASLVLNSEYSETLTWTLEPIER